MIFTTDLHSHILPGIDDGSPDLSTSFELLRMEKEQGIKRIALTPHFNPENDSVESFLNRREYAFSQLQTGLHNSDLDGFFDLRPGAEIRYSAKLVEMDHIKDLCIRGTNVLLIEFSFRHHPAFASEVFYKLQSMGFIPLLAHVERFPWLRDDPDFLYDMVCAGAYTQVNCESIVNDRDGLAFIRKMLKFGLIHTIGTDTHNVDKRPPMVNRAEKKLSENPGKETVAYINEMGESFLAGRIPDAVMPSKPKSSFWDFLRK